MHNEQCAVHKIKQKQTNTGTELKRVIIHSIVLIMTTKQHRITPERQFVAETRSIVKIMNDTLTRLSITHLNHCRPLHSFQKFHLLTPMHTYRKTNITGQLTEK